MAKIDRAARVLGKNLFLREIVEDDAGFVLELRTNPDKSKFLSETSGMLEEQIDWIRKYKTRDDQAYFIVCHESGVPLGCIRMYDPIGLSYCWGSWLLKSGLGPLVAIESALLIYAYGKYLGFTEARIDVRQANEHVWKFHEKFSSAELIKQDQRDRFYIVNAHKIDHMLSRYKDFLSNPLIVESHSIGN